MKPKTKDESVLADIIYGKLLGRRRLSGHAGLCRTTSLRVAASVAALESAGRDWISAVRSRRFLRGYETVGRILAYAEEPPHGGSEVRKLLRELGLDAEHESYWLYCGNCCKGLLEDDIVRRAWFYAAQAAEELKDFDALAAAV